MIVWPVVQTPDLFTTQAEFEVEQLQADQSSTNAQSKGKPPKKQKKTAESTIPRKPKNPFYYYCRTERHRVIEQHGQMTQEESNKILSAQWNVPGFDKKRNAF